MASEYWEAMAWVVLIIGYCSCWYYYYCGRRRRRRLNNSKNEELTSKIKSRKNDDGGGKGVIPEGSSGWPFIGETLDFISSAYTSRPSSFMDSRKSLYGSMFRTNLLGKPVIVSTDPEVNKVVLQNHGNVFVPSYPKSISELLGESSILKMNGNLHKRMHSCMSRFFKSPDLKARLTADIENSVKNALSNWKRISCLQNHDHHLVYIQDETKKFAFEILVKALMNIGPGEDMELLRTEYKAFIKGLICVPINLPGTQLNKSLKAKKNLLEMIRRIVEERKPNSLSTTTSQTTEEDTNDDDHNKSNLNDDDDEDNNNNSSSSGINNVMMSSDAIGVLLRDVDEDQHVLPLDFISGNIIEMMIPGEDSVPMVMTLAVKFLSDNPLALHDLKEENMELKRQKMASFEGYVWTDYMSLPFTQDVISETLRMANIVNAIWRQATKDVNIKGYLIPKGWCVMASLTSVHMDEHNYEHPYDFDPWRWKKGGVSAYNSTTFTPFGGGQRLCPGLELARLEIAIFLHHLVTAYRWVAEKDDIVYFPTVKMKRRLPIRITPL